jgi:hypothetical protein
MAEVNIGEIHTTVRTGEGGGTLDAATLARLVEAVLRALERQRQSELRQAQVMQIGEPEQPWR